MPSTTRLVLPVLVTALLLTTPVQAFDQILSDEAVREAYFLGQRRDETTANFLNKYTRHLAPPESGPYISYVSFFTPYANAVELARQNQFGNSAQDALREYRKHGTIIRVVISVEFTAGYNVLIEQPTGSRSGSAQGFKRRSPDFWRDFSYRLFQKDQAINPINTEGQATYGSAPGGGTADLSGAIVTLYFEADSLAGSDDADVVVDTINNQQTVATFDLAALR